MRVRRRVVDRLMHLKLLRVDTATLLVDSSRLHLWLTDVALRGGHLVLRLLGRHGLHVCLLLTDGDVRVLGPPKGYLIVRVDSHRGLEAAHKRRPRLLLQEVRLLSGVHRHRLLRVALHLLTFERHGPLLLLHAVKLFLSLILLVQSRLTKFGRLHVSVAHLAAAVRLLHRGRPLHGLILLGWLRCDSVVWKAFLHEWIELRCGARFKI